MFALTRTAIHPTLNCPGELAVNQRRKIESVYYVVWGVQTLVQVVTLSILVLFYGRVLPEGVDYGKVALILVGFTYFFEMFSETLTGQFADRHGRSKAILACGLSLLLSAFSFMAAALLAGPSIYIGLVGGIVFFLLGTSFVSGSLEAWLVDSLKHQANVSDYAQCLATAGWIANGLWFVGGYLALWFLELSLVLPWCLTLACSLLVCLLSKVMHEPYFEKIALNKPKPLLRFLVDSYRTIRLKRNLWVLSLVFAGTYVLACMVIELWVAIYDGAATDVSGVATAKVAWLIFGLFRFVGSLAAHVLAKRQSYGRTALLFTSTFHTLPVFVACGLLLLLGNSIAPLWAYVLLVSFSKANNETLKPIQSALIHQNIDDSSQRATIISMGVALGAAIMFVLSVVMGIAFPSGSTPFEIFAIVLMVTAILSVALTVPACLYYRDKTLSKRY